MKQKIIPIIMIIILIGTNLISLGNEVIAASIELINPSDTTVPNIDKENTQNIESEPSNSQKNPTNEISVVKQSKAEISIIDGKEYLSTVNVNESVEIRVVLDTSSTNNLLFKNPTLEIEFPKEITKVSVKDVNLLLDDELKIKETITTKKDGKQIIKVVLEGTQTKYMTQAIKTDTKNVITKGANIIINTDITVDELAASKTDSLKLSYTNENSGTSNSAGITLVGGNTNSQTQITTTDIHIISPNGVAISNKITGHSDVPLVSTSSEKQEAIVKTGKEKSTITIEGTLTNNNTNNIENLVILGRLPFANNKVIDEQTALGSNFDMQMIEKITVNGIDKNKVKVFYSSNGEATKDILTATNNWGEDPEELKYVKSYLIIVSGEIAKETEIKFNYKVELPANLEHEKSSYQMFKAYYDTTISETKVFESKTSSILGLVTGKGPKLDIKLTSNMPENSEVTGSQIVTFNVETKNIGEVEAKKVTINLIVPEGTTYTKYNNTTGEYEDSKESKILIPVGDLKVGESIKTNYTLKINDNAPSIIKHNVIVAAEELLEGVSSNEYTLNKKEQKIVLTLSTPRNPEDALYKGNIIYTTLLLETLEDVKNLKVNLNIPNGINIKSAKYLNNAMEEQEYIKIANNNIEINVPELKAGYIESVSLELQINDIKGDFNIQAKAQADSMGDHNSNALSFYVGAPDFEIKQTITSTKYIKEAEEIKFEFTIKNIGNCDANDVVFENILPEGLTFKKLSYTYQGTEKAITSGLNNTAKVRWTTFEKDAIAKITVTAKADLLENGKEKNVKNVGNITAQAVDKKISNSIDLIIEYNSKLYEGNPGNTSKPSVDNSGSSNNTGNNNTNSNNNNNNTNNNNNNSSNTNNNTNNNNEQVTPNEPTFKITGSAWLDVNKNGIKEEREVTMGNVEVMLIKKDTYEIVTDLITGDKKITKTNSDGTYEFTGLKKDEYLVIFLYDAGKYNITQYNVEGTSPSYNSDAVFMQILLNGKQTMAGVTDTIKITDSNIRDIDIGMYLAEKFDLKLETYINKITLTTPTIGTKVYNYNNSQLQKIEVLKQNLNNSNIVVEYKIKVSNEGQIAGYVKKIIDYIPTGAIFNSELNKDWYVAENGQVAYNTSLENVKINPGETKEISLVLTIQITDKNVGTVINNSAEIYESYNEKGVQDMDSEVANKLETEDDFSVAGIMLAVVTGKIVIYTSLAISILFILVLGTVVIKRKVLTNKL